MNSLQGVSPSHGGQAFGSQAGVEEQEEFQGSPLPVSFWECLRLLSLLTLAYLERLLEDFGDIHLWVVFSPPNYG